MNDLWEICQNREGILLGEGVWIYEFTIVTHKTAMLTAQEPHIYSHKKYCYDENNIHPISKWRPQTKNLIQDAAVG